MGSVKTHYSSFLIPIKNSTLEGMPLNSARSQRAAPGLWESKQARSGWRTTVPLKESSVSFPHTESFEMLGFFPPRKPNISPLQVLPLTHQNHWLFKWNPPITYYRDTVHEKKWQGVSCHYVLLKNCREKYSNYNCFTSISENTHFSYC